MIQTRLDHDLMPKYILNMCERIYVCVCVWAYECVCVWVRERERERERERAYLKMNRSTKEFECGILGFLSQIIMLNSCLTLSDFLQETKNG